MGGMGGEVSTPYSEASGLVPFSSDGSPSLALPLTENSVQFNDQIQNENENGKEVQSDP